MWDKIREKLAILADAAKYDVSCASSGSNRTNKNKGLGDSTGMGICHTFTEDGRCVALLKILLTNFCIYDCAYCTSRKSSDIKRAAFTVEEVVELTINFYRRNYIEGLFLSSGIFKNSDYTMERLVRIAKKLRLEHNFNGYIHLKGIPGASDELMKEAGLYADRLSVNIELPTNEGLQLLAPDKNREDMLKPMKYVKDTIIENRDEKKIFKKTPRFTPAGQSTQMVIGATKETDWQIVQTANYLYKNYSLKRVYYSGYVPISNDSRLPALTTQVPVIRENRLYQTDWLMRFYGFQANEIVNAQHPYLELDMDPKLAWALRNLDQFPIDINKADYNLIVRVPGIGVQSAKKIIAARKYQRLQLDHLKKIGVVISRARYFIICDQFFEQKEYSSEKIKHIILTGKQSKFQKLATTQYSLF